jgi:hypothetical protein
MKKLHPTVQELLTEIEAYRARARMDRTAFGLQAVKDGNFITRLEHGRVPTFKTVDRVRAFIARKSKAVHHKQKETPREAIKAAMARITYDERGHRRPFRRAD